MKRAFAALFAAGTMALAGQAGAAVFTVTFSVGPGGWGGVGTPYGLPPLVFNGFDVIGPTLSGSLTGDTVLLGSLPENGVETLTSLNWTTGSRTWTLADINIATSYVLFGPSHSEAPSAFNLHFFGAGNDVSQQRVALHDLSVPNGGAFAENDHVTLVGLVPEPASWALMLLGFAGLGAMLRRRAAYARPNDQQAVGVPQ